LNKVALYGKILVLKEASGIGIIVLVISIMANVTPAVRTTFGQPFIFNMQPIARLNPTSKGFGNGEGPIKKTLRASIKTPGNLGLLCFSFARAGHCS
jgi:hypothetical protein